MAMLNGVFFALRHELLNCLGWTAPPLGLFGGIECTVTDLPLIWFPWFDALHDYNIKIDLENYENDPDVYNYVRPTPPKTSTLRKFGGVELEYFAEVGDRIVIDYVEKIPDWEFVWTTLTKNTF
jgi:hypothetical protein